MENTRELKKTNYCELCDRSLFYRHFIYIDAGDNHVGDNILIRNGVRVKFLHDISHPNFDINIVHCKVLKSDVDKFIKSMKELNNAHLIFGTPDYYKFLIVEADNVNDALSGIKEVLMEV